MRSTLLIVAVAFVAALVGGGVVALVDDDSGDARSSSAGTGTSTGVAGAPEGGTEAERVYERTQGSVVFVTAQITQTSTSPFGTQEGAGESTGTGFVVGADGTIATNAHVIEGATDVRVTIGDQAARAAEIVGSDGSTDVALLRVTSSSGGTLKPLAFADSDDVRVGEAVYAIGNPYGLDRTLTAGLVSALQREITSPNGFSISGVIQTDAAINPGNSGGPLLDSDGAVIGITSQIISGGSSSEGGNVGIGFAVPSNTVRNVLAQLRRNGRAEHAFLGAQTTDAPADGGAAVAAVTAGGPAQRAGIAAGDVIVRFGDATIASSSDLSAAVNAREPGEQVAVTVTRDGAQRTLDVTLGTQPAAASSSTTPTTP